MVDDEAADPENLEATIDRMRGEIGSPGRRQALHQDRKRRVRRRRAAGRARTQAKRRVAESRGRRRRIRSAHRHHRRRPPAHQQPQNLRRRRRLLEIPVHEQRRPPGPHHRAQHAVLRPRQGAAAAHRPLHVHAPGGRTRRRRGIGPRGTGHGIRHLHGELDGNGPPAHRGRNERLRARADRERRRQDPVGDDRWRRCRRTDRHARRAARQRARNTCAASPMPTTARG